MSHKANINNPTDRWIIDINMKYIEVDITFPLI